MDRYLLCLEGGATPVERPGDSIPPWSPAFASSMSTDELARIVDFLLTRTAPLASTDTAPTDSASTDTWAGSGSR